MQGSGFSLDDKKYLSSLSHTRIPSSGIRGAASAEQADAYVPVGENHLPI
jgi:hypothetical protein